MKLFHALSLWIILFSGLEFHWITFRPKSTETVMPSATRIVVEEDRRLLTIGQGSAWFWNTADQVIEQIDLTTGRSTAIKIPLPFTALTGSVEAGSLWILSDHRDKVAQVDLTTYELVATIDTSAYFEPWEFVNIVTGEGTVWLKGEEMVLQIDPRTHQIQGEPIPGGEEIIVATVANGELWTGSHDDGLITRVDLQTNQINAQFELGFSVHGLAVSVNSAWVLDEHGFAVVQVDLKTNRVTSRVPIDFVGSNIAVLNDDLWVVPAARDSGRPTNNDTLLRIDVQTVQVIEEIHVGQIRSLQDGYYLVLAEDGEAWAVIFDDELTTLLRLSERK